MNVFYFVSFNEPLELWLQAKKKEMVLLKISILSRVPMGQLLQMKFRPKTRNMIRSENVCFFHDKEKGVMFFPNLLKISIFSGQIQPFILALIHKRLKSHQRSREHEDCGMRIQHELKERATTELKDG